VSDDDRELARERSHQDAKTTNDNARAAAQAAILINGGAATALLALASKSSEVCAAVQKVGLWSLGLYAGSLVLYAGGVALGAFMMFFMHRSIQKWTIVWEGRARVQPYSAPTIQKAQKRGSELRHSASVCFVCAIACFVVGSVALGVNLFISLT
jgi:hypothetical protein